MSNLPMFTWLQIEVMKMQSIAMHCFLLLCLANIELPKKICPKLLMLINIPLGRPLLDKYMWSKLGRTLGGGDFFENNGVMCLMKNTTITSSRIGGI